jgi:hypothetical protein
MAPIRSSLCDISLRQTAKKMVIDLYISHGQITTEHMPHVKSILQTKLPSILLSKCFNSKNLPFAKEVEATELGHAFEHILLEYLCLTKMSLGCQEARFSGITSWNWNRKKYGTFSITIGIEKEDALLISPALQKTIRLFEEILTTEQNTHQNKTYTTLHA